MVIHRDDSQSVFNKNQKLRVGIMLDNYHPPAWISATLGAILQSDYASLELVLLNENREEKKSCVDAVLADRDTVLYRAYTKLEERISQPNPAFTRTDTRSLLKNVPVLGIQPETNKTYDGFSGEDLEKIKKSRLDVIIQCGFRLLRGDILKAAKYGIWSYDYADTAVIRGGPPGFWETFGRMGERGALIRVVTEDPDNGIILNRSFFPCDSLFVSRNNNACFLRLSAFVPRMLKRLHDEGEKAFFDTIERENKKLPFYDNVMHTAPSNVTFLTMVIPHAFRMGTNLMRSTFFRPHFFLMYDLSDELSTSFWRYKKIMPPRDRFWADPHVIFRDDVYYLFIEEYLYATKKAHISLIEMQQSGTCSEPVKVLEEPFHLSYPHVFEYNGTVYMIPETRKAKSINLYRCTDFPTGWKYQATLMDSVHAVDSTLLFHKNRWWLFTNIAEPEGTSLHNELYLFSSDNLVSRDWKSHPMNPVISDVKRARPAGKILEHRGTLYRPSQCCSPRYGYGLKLNEIVDLTDTIYSEKEIAFIEPRWDRHLKGVHHICHENRLTMIDGYYLKAG